VPVDLPLYVLGGRGFDAKSLRGAVAVLGETDNAERVVSVHDDCPANKIAQCQLLRRHDAPDLGLRARPHTFDAFLSRWCP
jgi:hypothetical protein